MYGSLFPARRKRARSPSAVSPKKPSQNPSKARRVSAAAPSSPSPDRPDRPVRQARSQSQAHAQDPIPPTRHQMSETLRLLSNASRGRSDSLSDTE